MEIVSFKKTILVLSVTALVSGILAVNVAMGVAPVKQPNEVDYVGPTFSIVNVLSDLNIGGTIQNPSGTDGVKIYDTEGVDIRGNIFNGDNAPVTLDDAQGINLQGNVSNNTPVTPFTVNDADGINLQGNVINNAIANHVEQPVYVTDTKGLQVSKKVDARDYIVNEYTTTNDNNCILNPLQGCVPDVVEYPVKVQDDLQVTGNSDFKGSIYNSTADTPVTINDDLEARGISANDISADTVFANTSLGANALDFSVQNVIKINPGYRNGDYWYERAVCPAGTVLINCTFSTGNFVDYYGGEHNKDVYNKVDYPGTNEMIYATNTCQVKIPFEDWAKADNPIAQCLYGYR